jgi:hypothetical protein
LGLAIGECPSLVGVELDILDRKKELEDVTETDKYATKHNQI